MSMGSRDSGRWRHAGLPLERSLFFRTPLHSIHTLTPKHKQCHPSSAKSWASRGPSPTSLRSSVESTSSLAVRPLLPSPTWRFEKGTLTTREHYLTGTNGIGLSVSRTLYSHGADVTILGSQQNTADAALDYIKTGELARAPQDYQDSFAGILGTWTDNSADGGKESGEVRARVVDFKDLKAVAKVAKELADSYDRLDGFLGIAGIGVNKFTLTDDGFEYVCSSLLPARLAVTDALLPPLRVQRSHDDQRTLAPAPPLVPPPHSRKDVQGAPRHRRARRPRGVRDAPHVVWRAVGEYGRRQVPHGRRVPQGRGAAESLRAVRLTLEALAGCLEADPASRALSAAPRSARSCSARCVLLPCSQTSAAADHLCLSFCRLSSSATSSLRPRSSRSLFTPVRYLDLMYSKPSH